MEITWKQFYTGQLPNSVAPEDLYTLEVLRSLRKSFDGDMLGAFMKWGVVFIQDFSAMLCFAECKETEGASNEEASKVTGNILKRVDWDLLQKMMEEGAAEYTTYCHLIGEGAKIEPYLAGLQYKLTLQEIPGVREPGDLYKRLVEAHS